ncbi:Outer membrane efflux protein BepC [Polaribacter huanghezhanensis]|uniref:TolC family protein n=1 Tax=Polaribacter huanghezhanensis TaxID=1354726 RepID=UPI002647ED13|nr:TolC family protein [Polaribacter huanghezhanensis]WKD85052.1 Outer membrane efflux protein BepC [Polaribacter huanghezhanensis]
MKKFINSISIAVVFFSVLSVSAQKKWSLKDCILYAKEHNINVLKQKIQSEISNSDVVIAKGNYLPNASFNASQNFSLGNSFDVSTGVGKSESRSNSFSLSSSTLIFKGFSNKYTLQKSKLNKLKAASEIDKIRFDLRLNVTNKFLQVLFQKELLKIAEDQVVISKNNFDRLKLLYEEILISKRDLLEIEATLASDRKEVIVIKNKVNTSLIELKELLGINEIENFDIDELIDDNFEQKSNEFYDITNLIIENNPTIKTAQFSLELKKKDIQLAKSNFYPSINFNYSYGSNYYHIQGRKDEVLNQQTNQLIDNGFWTQLNSNRTHYLGFSASIPIFNRFSTRENYKKSKEELKIAEIELKNNKFLLRNKIIIALNDLNTAKASLKASEIAYLTQKEAFNIVQENYKRGNITNVVFLESKSKMTRNASEYVKAKFEFIFKLKVVKYYNKV